LAPSAAVVRTARGAFAFVTGDDGRTFVPRLVSEGQAVGGRIIVPDLAEGTEVLVAGTAFAELESAVRVVFAGAGIGIGAAAPAAGHAPPGPR
jgi:hypothetical protein